ncbi:MAG: parallel beta-helix repeat [Verrucomicrobia bacterium]|nr:parallel beta-helix repeat [Verrucomicrobiota bacterium]
MNFSLSQAAPEARAPAATSLLPRIALILACAACSSQARAGVGADLPWVTYEAEAMKTTGRVLGPRYDPHLVETEASGQKCVKLAAPGDFVEFSAAATANALVIRYSLLDAKEGGGTATNLELFINGNAVRTLALSSRYAWLYGTYPFSNRPDDGKPRNFYDEVRVKDLRIAKGDVIRLQRGAGDAAECIVDLVDLENVPAALEAPTNALSVLDFGAGGKGGTDDTDALRRCVAEAQKQGRPAWVPAGDYQLTGEIRVPSGVTIQGAGMWHTTFVGDGKLYGQPARRVRFKLVGSHIHLADFAIVGKLDYRNDQEPNDGVVGAGCADSVISNVWLEHTKVGIWIYNGTNLVIDGCRFRDLLADGVNLCVGTGGTVIRNCTARGTGDDCFAIWPAPSDQGFVGQGPRPGNNVIRHCTGQLTFLANGGAIYGGADNRIEDCLFTDIASGCGILVSTTFPTSDEERKVDNNFSGTTEIRDCELLRCGGYDHNWAWRGSFQICLDRRSISGLAIRRVTIRDSLSSGLTIVAPGSKKGEGTLSEARLEQVKIINSGIGGSPSHDVWIHRDASGRAQVVDSQIADIRNESVNFRLPGAPAR